MKPDGSTLIDSLIRRKVWIDLAHANELEILEIIPTLKSKKIPLLITHTEIREVFPAERGLGSPEINYLKAQGGMIGLIPTEDLIINTRPKDMQTSCDRGVALFKDIFKYAQQNLGELQVALGSDINAPLKGLAPDCKLQGGIGQTELLKKGFYNYSQWKELSDYLSQDPTWNQKIQEAFLSTWDRIR